MVSTQLKNISQTGSFPQIGMKIKNIWKHHPVKHYSIWCLIPFFSDMLKFCSQNPSPKGRALISNTGITSRKTSVWHHRDELRLVGQMVGWANGWANRLVCRKNIHDNSGWDRMIVMIYSYIYIYLYTYTYIFVIAVYIYIYFHIYTTYVYLLVVAASQ